jgi:hypothetical protein
MWLKKQIWGSKSALKDELVALGDDALKEIRKTKYPK